jgi:hypothetical protein
MLPERSVQTPSSINATGPVGGTYQLHFAPRHRALVRAGPPGRRLASGHFDPRCSRIAFLDRSRGLMLAIVACAPSGTLGAVLFLWSP